MDTTRILATLATAMCFLQVCVATGYFELQILKVKNLAGELEDGECCDGERGLYGVCNQDECDTYFKLCLKEYQSIPKRVDSTSCTFGSRIGPQLGGNSFQLNKINSASPGRIVIGFQFAWMRTYTMILEALDNDNRTAYDREPKSQLIERVVHSGMLNPGDQWHTKQHNGPIAHIEYKIRVRCEEHYYGFNCTKFCRPRNGFFGHFTCDHAGNKKCLDGWMGKECNIAKCKTGCSAEHGKCSSPNECKCDYGWQGELCDKCVPYPGCEHGTCTKPWQCQCDTNWGGLLCDKNLNYCGTFQPCLNGGTCTNPEPDHFECKCTEGYKGKNCEIAEYACVSNPCANGGVCEEEPGGFRCDCPAGWTGHTCRINIDDCEFSPCAHGGVCHDLVNGFHCECPPHWEGSTCQLDADECKDSPCVHAVSCHNLPGHYHCVCEAGWEGTNCDTNTNDCHGQCRNGATCMDLVNGFQCDCASGFKGEKCEININDCAGGPCLHGGQCIDQINGYHCICPAGYSGRRCELEEGYCEPNPCSNGAQCFNLNNDYYCNCSDKYIGKNCSQLRDHCETGICEVIDSCRIRVTSNNSDDVKILESGICGSHGNCVSLHGNKYKCDCDRGFDGQYCQRNIDDCTHNSCQNGGTCVDDVNGFFCMCRDGWEGDNCEINVDDCSPDPCHGRGRCIDLDDDFICQCERKWKGKTCNSRAMQCDEETCANGGKCVTRDSSFVCHCPEGWTGQSCHLRTTSVCADSPCQNGGTCVGDGNEISCFCREGFTGLRCEEDVNDCNPYPCYNGGKCIDGENHYKCECPTGFAGPECRININDCASSPCAYGSTCIDGINEYTCVCPPGRFGKRCQTVDGPAEACLRHGTLYPHGESWNEACNKCKCNKGVTNCTKIWCGPPVCFTSTMSQNPSCPQGRICEILPQTDCFTPECKARGVCRSVSEISEPPSRGWPPLDVAPKCFPNKEKFPPTNCARITLVFDRDEMPQGIYVQDICTAIRLVPALIQYASSHLLVIRCAIQKTNPDGVQITISMNSTKDGDLASHAADSLSNALTNGASSFPLLDAIKEVKLETTIVVTDAPKAAQAQFMMPLLISLIGAVVLLCSLGILCLCFARRRRRRRRRHNDDVMSSRHDLPMERDNSSRTLLSPKQNNIAEISAKLTKSNRTEEKNLYRREVLQVRVRTESESDIESIDVSKQNLSVSPPSTKVIQSSGRSSSRGIPLSAGHSSNDNRRYASPPTTSTQLNDVSDDDTVQEEDSVFLSPSSRHDDFTASYSSDSEVATLLYRPHQQQPHSSGVTPTPSRAETAQFTRLPPYDSIVNSRHSSASGVAGRSTSPPPSYTRHYKPYSSRTQQRSCACSPSNTSDVTTTSQHARQLPMTSSHQRLASSSSNYLPEGNNSNNNNNRYSISASNRSIHRNNSENRTRTPDIRPDNRRSPAPDNRRNSSVLSVNLRHTHEVTV
ncbi:protein jagged-1b-like [Styela clava]